MKVSLKKLKSNRAITLIALVVTIIVLLILAGVTVVTLTGDNGLLQKATTAKEKNEEAEICENIKLAYGEYKIEQNTGTDKTAEEIIENSLKSTYGNDITNVKVKNEKVTVDMKVNNIPKTYIYKANTGEAYEYIDPFDYGGKEKKDLVPGDDISIGTENFRVFYNQNGVIKAMCFFNLKLDSNPMRQATVEEATNGQEGRVKFSKRAYWSRDENGNEIEGWNSNAVNGELDIDMDNPDNNIQDYINAYEKKMDTLGVERIEVRIARRNELNISGITGNIKNPGQKGRPFLAWK